MDRNLHQIEQIKEIEKAKDIPSNFTDGPKSAEDTSQKTDPYIQRTSLPPEPPLTIEIQAENIESVNTLNNSNSSTKYHSPIIQEVLIDINCPNNLTHSTQNDRFSPLQIPKTSDNASLHITFDKKVSTHQNPKRALPTDKQSRKKKRPN